MPESPPMRVIKQSDNDAAVLRALRSWFDSPIAHCAVVAGAENGADTRRFTVRVRDRLREPWAGRWRVMVYIAATPGGAPSATGNTVSFVNGTVLATITANAAYDVLTESDGTFAFDLTVAGAASRAIETMVLGIVRSGTPVTYAA